MYYKYCLLFFIIFLNLLQFSIQQSNGNHRDAAAVVTKIGEKCKDSDDCNIEFSECKNKECVCNNGFVKSNNGKQCLKVVKSLGDHCEQNVQCFTKIKDSVCSNNTCICDEKHEVNGVCYKNAELGHECSVDPECSLTKYAMCVNSTCECIKGYAPGTKKGNCLVVAERNGSACTDNNQCSATLGEFSHCVDGTCRCKELYHYKEKMNKCIEDMLLGDLCAIHSDCHDPYLEKDSRLECIAGVCACRSWYKEKNGICIENHGTRMSYVNTTLFFSIFFVISFFI